MFDIIVWLVFRGITGGGGAKGQLPLLPAAFFGTLIVEKKEGEEQKKKDKEKKRHNS